MTHRCVLYFDYKRGDVGDGDSVKNVSNQIEFLVVQSVLK